MPKALGNVFRSIAPIAVAVIFTALGMPYLAPFAAIGFSLLMSAVLPPDQPKGPEATLPELQDRKQTVRSSITSHKLVPGMAGAGGAWSFLDTTATNTTLHLLYTLAGHAITDVSAIFVDDNFVPIGSDGNALTPPNNPDGTPGKSYAGVLFAIFGDGTVAGDAKLHAELRSVRGSTKWGLSCRQDSRAKAYVRFTWNTNIYSSIPNVTFIVRGKRVYDPRKPSVAITGSAAGTGILTTSAPHGLVPGDMAWLRDHSGSVPPIFGSYEVLAVATPETFTVAGRDSATLVIEAGGSGGSVQRLDWTDNAPLLTNDYLCDPIYGYAARYERDIPEAELIAAANVADEMVALAAPPLIGFTTDATADTLKYLTDQEVPLGAEIMIVQGGPPSPLVVGIIYFAVPISSLEMKLASTYANALAGTTLDLTSSGSGQIQQVFTFVAATDPALMSQVQQQQSQLPGSGITAGLVISTVPGVGATTVKVPWSQIQGANNPQWNLNSLWLFSGQARLLTGTRVQVVSDGTLPTPLRVATDYYAIFITDKIVKLAASLDDARQGRAILLTDAGQGQHRILPTAEPRYTLNGITDTSKNRDTILKDMLSAMAGYIVPNTFAIFAGAWRTPMSIFDENALDGAIEVASVTSAQQSFNSIKGTYVDPFSNWVPTDLPILQDQSYIDDDNGEVVLQPFTFPYTNSAPMGQRLAVIQLEMVRREITVTMSMKLVAVALKVPQNFLLNNESWGFTNKTFECQSWGLSVKQDQAGNPYYGIDVVARESDAQVYAWDTTKQLPHKTWISTTLPNPFQVAMPTGLVLSSGTADLDVRKDGTIFSRIRVRWQQAQDQFVLSGGNVEVQYKKSTDTQWLSSHSVPGDQTESFILDVQDTVAYDVRIRFVNSIGAKSPYSEIDDYEVIGKTEAPSDVAFLLGQMSGQIIVFIWPDVPDPDIAGYELRYVAQGVPGIDFDRDWFTLQKLPEIVKGAGLTTAALPLGTYIVGIKAVDTSGNYSAHAALTVVTVTARTTYVIDQHLEPDWANCELVGFVQHWDGKLIPESTKAANLHTNVELFEQFVPYPVAGSSAAGPAVDTGFDDAMRVFATITAKPGRDQTTDATGPTLAVDSWLTGQQDHAVTSPPGWTEWTIGPLTLRYLRGKATLTNEAGHVQYLQSVEIIADAPTKIVNTATNVTISPGGTSVTFPNPYHAGLTAAQIAVSPSVRGSAPLIATVSAVTATTVTFHIWNLSGTDVGGVLDYTAEGV